MSIVTDPGRNRIIFCEGEAGSPDIILWTQLLINDVTDQPKYRCKITPMGGKAAAKNFATGFAAATGNANWRILRDRDLDAESEGALVRWGAVLLTGCTSIESYFVSPDLIAQYLDLNELTAQQKITDHQQALHDALVELRDYQAVRWGLQAVRRNIEAEVRAKKLHRTAGVFDLPNRLTDEDGRLPLKLDLATCQQDAATMCSTFRDTFQHIELDVLDQAIARHRVTFEGEDFWQSGFRYWFHGKDVLKHWMKRYSNIDHAKYCNWVASNFTKRWPNWKQQFPDLAEIQRICQTETDKSG